MTEPKHKVTIKGVKDGLVFWINDTCPLEEAIAELEHKLDKTHHNILTGPVIHVHVKLGNRPANEEEKERIRQIIRRKGNLIVQSVESEAPDAAPPAGDPEAITVMKGIVRSGQTIRHEGNLLFLGDVNPGGTLLCTGDIFILGALRGMAHAGAAGNERAIIAASYMRPTQLRIAEVISRPPDEWGIENASMEFAYIRAGHMEIDKISQLHRLRPDHPLEGV